MAGEITVRLAGAEDSETFAQWIAQSKQIPVEDVRASLKEENPTSVTLVLEQDGKVLLFFPSYAVAMIAFLGFNPDTTPAERLAALEKASAAAEAFWGMHGVTTIATLSKEKYPIAKWAKQHGFYVEPRQVFLRTAKQETGKALEHVQ